VSLLNNISNKMEEILKLDKLRYEHLNKMEKSFNPDTFDYDYMPKEIDELSKQIKDLILSDKDDLPVDFIIEQLTKLGESPCLLVNDNTGKFSIACDGMQDVPNTVDEDMEITHWIKNNGWSNTIREALNKYLTK
jgi:hypothetical protein